jgi:hypothetical protein
VVEGTDVPVVEPTPAEEMVEAAIESAAIPAVEPAPAEAIVEAAIESAAIPEPEPEPQLERVLETVGAGNGAQEAEAEAERPPSHRQPAVPEGVDIHPVTEKPASPRRGWWTRLIQ